MSWEEPKAGMWVWQWATPKAAPWAWEGETTPQLAWWGWQGEAWGTPQAAWWAWDNAWGPQWWAGWQWQAEGGAYEDAGAAAPPKAAGEATPPKAVEAVPATASPKAAGAATPPKAAQAVEAADVWVDESWNAANLNKCQLCDYHIMAACKRGALCAYAHDLRELRPPPAGWPHAKTDFPTKGGMPSEP